MESFSFLKLRHYISIQNIYRSNTYQTLGETCSARGKSSRGACLAAQQLPRAGQLPARLQDLLLRLCPGPRVVLPAGQTWRTNSGHGGGGGGGGGCGSAVSKAVPALHIRSSAALLRQCGILLVRHLTGTFGLLLRSCLHVLARELCS